MYSFGGGGLRGIGSWAEKGAINLPKGLHSPSPAAKGCSFFSPFLESRKLDGLRPDSLQRQGCTFPLLVVCTRLPIHLCFHLHPSPLLRDATGPPVPNVNGKEIHTKELWPIRGFVLHPETRPSREISRTLIFTFHVAGVRTVGVDSVRLFLFCLWKDGLEKNVLE